MFDHRGNSRYTWDIFIIFLALYNSVVTPLDFSFDYMSYTITKPPWNWIERFIEVCYYLDIYVGFTTSYINHYSGEVFYGPGKLAKNYMINGSFFIDFLSTFRFGMVIKVTNQNLLLFFKALKLLKVLRVKKVSKIIRASHIEKEIKAISQVLYYTLILVIYTHLVACIMWWLLKTKAVWSPAVDFGNIYTDVFGARADRDEFD